MSPLKCLLVLGLLAACEPATSNLGLCTTDNDCLSGYRCNASGECEANPSGPVTGAVCRNGVVEPPEQCDDGNNINGDGCENDCTHSPATNCGDGNVDPGEQCDNGANNSNTIPNACRTNCTNARCGDTVIDNGEQCDNGASNSNTAPNACRTDCTPARCGDGVTDSGEQCDDANSTNGDGCENDCTNSPAATCGDGNVDPGEQCDNGVNNSNTVPNACRTNCTNARCGDGVTDNGEGCDEGAQNSNTQPNACRLDCSVASCGDGVVDNGEVCDDGALNSNTQPNACRMDCSAPSCGDGVVDNGEGCDNGALNSNTQPNACRLDCSSPMCGDGVVDNGEACDNGTQNSNTTPNACRTSCMLASCGDGVIDNGEVCDNGALNSNTQPNACRLSCMPASCGDGVVDTGEQCDGSTTLPGMVCQTCALSCAPGFADCNSSIGDGCEADLTSPATCGSCSNACLSGDACMNGVCTEPPGPSGTLSSRFNNGEPLPLGIIDESTEVIEATTHMALDQSGRILVMANIYATGGNRAEIRRILPDGTMDTGFNPPPAIVGYEPCGIHVTSTGKILVAVFARSSSLDPIVARLNDDGSVNTTYPIPSALNGETGICQSELLADDRLVIGGSRINSNSRGEWWLAMYRSNGTLDTNFDGDGYKEIQSIGTSISADSLGYVGPDLFAVDDSNRTYVGFPGSVYRVTSSGASTSHSIPNRNFLDPLRAAQYIADPAGGIYVLYNELEGSGPTDPRNAVVARLTPSGSHDTTFGDSGHAVHMIGTSNNEETVRFAVGSDGAIYVGGTRNTADSSVRREAFLMSFTASGQRDETFPATANPECLPWNLQGCVLDLGIYHRDNSGTQTQAGYETVNAILPTPAGALYVAVKSRFYNYTIGGFREKSYIYKIWE